MFSEFKNIPLDREFLSRLRGKLEIQTKLDFRETAATTRFGLKRIASVATLASLLLGSAGTVFASKTSVPGETLYPVKRLVENARLAASIDQNTKTNIRLELAKERLAEINFLLATNVTSSAELEKNIMEAASNFDSQLERVAQKAEELERAGELEKALRVNTDIFYSGKNYKKLIEKNKENSFEPIQNRLEDSSRETDKATEGAKERMERLWKKSEENKNGKEEVNLRISGEATISNNYNKGGVKPEAVIEQWTAPANPPEEKVESGMKNSRLEAKSREELQEQQRETNPIQIKIEP